MSKKREILASLKKSLEEKLLEETQETDNKDHEVDLVNDNEISSVVKELTDEEGQNLALQVHSSLGHEDLTVLVNDLKGQLKKKIDFYRNDVERIPDWGSSVSLLKTTEYQNYQEMRKALQESMSFKTPEDQLLAIENFRRILYQSDSILQDKTSAANVSLVESEKENNSIKAKSLVKEIHEEIEINLKFLLDELHRKNFLQREKLRELQDNFDLDDVIEKLDDNSVADIIQYIRVDLHKIRQSFLSRVIDKDNKLSKTELFQLIKNYKAGLRAALDKRLESLDNPNWSQFLDSLKRKSLGIAGYHEKQLTWGGQLNTLLKVLGKYSADVEALIESNYALTVTMGSKTKDPEAKRRKLAIKKSRLTQLEKLTQLINHGKHGKDSFGTGYLESLLKQGIKVRSNQDKKRIQENLVRRLHLLRKGTLLISGKILKLNSTDKYWKAFIRALSRLIKDLSSEMLGLLERYHQVGYKKWNTSLKLLDKLSKGSKTTIGGFLSKMEKVLKKGKSIEWAKSLGAINKTFYKRHSYVNKLADSLHVQNKNTWKNQLEGSSFSFYLQDTEKDVSTPFKFLSTLADKENWFNTEKPIFSAKKYITRRFKKPAKDNEGRIIQDTYGDIVDWAEMYLFPYLVYGYRTSDIDNPEEIPSFEALYNLHRPSKNVVDMFFDQLITPEGLVSQKRQDEDGNVINNSNFEAFFLKVLQNESNNFTRITMTPNGILINKDSEGSVAETGMDRRDKKVKNKTLFVSLDKTNTRLDDPQKENYSYIQKLKHFQNEFENIFEVFSGSFDKAMKDKFGEISIEYQWYKHYVSDESQQTARDELAVLQHNLRTVKPSLDTLPEETREVFLFKNPKYESERDQQLGQIKTTLQELSSMGYQYLNVDNMVDGKYADTKLEELAGWVKSQQEGSLLDKEEGETPEEYEERVLSLDKKLFPKFMQDKLTPNLGLELATMPSYRTVLKKKIKSFLPDIEVSPSDLKKYIRESWVKILKGFKPQLKRALTQEIGKDRNRKKITETSRVSPRELVNLYVSVPFFKSLIGDLADIEEDKLEDISGQLAKFEVINPVIQLGLLLKLGMREENKSEFEVMNMSLENKHYFVKRAKEARDRVTSYLKKLINDRGFNQTFLSIQEEFPEHFKTSAKIEKGIDSVIKEEFVENEDEELIENLLTEHDTSDQNIHESIPKHYLSDMAIQDV